jgi:type VI secretion system protein ImpB
LGNILRGQSDTRGLSFQVKNHVDPERETVLDIDLPIRSRRSFLPEAIAKNTPRIRALLLLRKLLLEIQSNIDNRKEVRRTIYELYQHPELITALKEYLGTYKSYRLPTGKELPGGDSATGSLPAKEPSNAAKSLPETKAEA